MTSRIRPLSRNEIAAAFSGPDGAAYPAILSPAQLSQLIGLSVKTVYEWIARGRLDGAFRKRGKHVLIVRDRAINLLLSGKEWKDERP